MFVQNDTLTSKALIKIIVGMPKNSISTLSPDKKEIKKYSIHHLATQSAIL